jgi:hypothetical protein
MIVIQKSETADTRTCDKTKVTKATLLSSSVQHIGDVGKGIAFFAGKLTEAASIHDYDKLSMIDWFHKDFTTEIVDAKGNAIPGGWLENHYKIHRHHLDKDGGVPEDVNLIDVLEHIADCVMAGMGRAGDVWPIKLSDELLQRAVANTAAMLKGNVIVAPSPGEPQRILT